MYEAQIESFQKAQEQAMNETTAKYEVKLNEALEKGRTVEKQCSDTVEVCCC